MPLNTWEKDFLAEIKARVLNKQSVSPREKQIVLDLMKREKLPMSQKALDAAAKEGMDISGIQVAS